MFARVRKYGVRFGAVSSGSHSCRRAGVAPRSLQELPVSEANTRPLPTMPSICCASTAESRVWEKPGARSPGSSKRGLTLRDSATSWRKPGSRANWQLVQHGAFDEICDYNVALWRRMLLWCRQQVACGEPGIGCERRTLAGARYDAAIRTSQFGCFHRPVEHFERAEPTFGARVKAGAFHTQCKAARANPNSRAFCFST